MGGGRVKKKEGEKEKLGERTAEGSRQEEREKQYSPVKKQNLKKHQVKEEETDNLSIPGKPGRS